MDNNEQKIKFFINSDNELFLDADSLLNDDVRDLCKVFGVEIKNKAGMSVKMDSPEFDDIQDAEIWLRDQPFWKPRVRLANIPILSKDSLKKMKVKELREVRDLLLDDEDIIGGMQYAKTIIAEYENEVNSDDYYVCGRCCAFFDDDQAAVRCYNKALEFSPDNMGVMIDKGILLLKLDQGEEAFKLLREAFKSLTPTAPIWLTVGLFYLNKNNIVKGVNALRRAIELEPDLGEEQIPIPMENKSISINEIIAHSKNIEEVSIEEILC
ncbi:MAG: hypothetical protein AAGU27_00970 [Dehalobacterium sp.]